MDRITLAMLLISLLAALIASFVISRMYHADQRTLRRNRRRAVASYELHMAQQSQQPPIADPASSVR
jgi:hypothetical protein